MSRYKNHRLLVVEGNDQELKNKFRNLLKQKENKKALIEYKLKTSFRKNSKVKFKLTLFGYDGEAKYSTYSNTQGQLNRIYNLIETMPMRKLEVARKKKSELYTDRNPKTTLQGTGFKDAKKALSTLELIKNRDLIYQFQVVNTMYNRAKFHPHRTKDMEAAMKIFKKWLDQYKKNKSK